MQDNVFIFITRRRLGRIQGWSDFLCRWSIEAFWSSWSIKSSRRQRKLWPVNWKTAFEAKKSETSTRTIMNNFVYISAEKNGFLFKEFGMPFVKVLNVLRYFEKIIIRIQSYRKRFKLWILWKLISCLEKKTNDCQSVSLFGGFSKAAIGLVKVNQVHLHWGSKMVIMNEWMKEWMNEFKKER